MDDRAVEDAAASAELVAARNAALRAARLGATFFADTLERAPKVHGAPWVTAAAVGVGALAGLAAGACLAAGALADVARALVSRDGEERTTT